MSTIVASLTSKIEELENKNKQLTDQIKELNGKINAQNTDHITENIKENIRKTAEEIFIQNIEEKVKQVQKGAFSKLDKIAEEKIHTIQVEKDEINTQFEDHKINIKNEISSSKVLIEEEMNTLSADLKKATNDINQLKRANDSKSDKLRKIKETHKNLWETLNKNAIDTTERVKEQIS